MENKKKAEAGFTLVEMLIGVSICAILIGAVFAASNGGSRSANFNRAQNTNVLQTKRVMERIIRELRYATAMTTPGSAELGTPLDQADFKINGLRRVIAKSQDNSVTISYYDVGGNLSETVTLARSITDTLSFTRNSSGRMKIAIRLKDPSRDDNPEMNTETMIRMFNLANP